MRYKVWKIASLILVLLIVGVFVFTQGFHYVSANGITFQGDNPENGTLIIVASLPNVVVKMNASFSFTGSANGPGEILLENGTSYIVNNSHKIVYLTAIIAGKWFSPVTSGYFQFGRNLSSYSEPVAVTVVNNYPLSDFNSQSLQSKLPGLGYIAMFVLNYTMYQVRAVAMPL